MNIERLQNAFIAATIITCALGVKEAVELDTAKDMQDRCFTAETRTERAAAHNWLIDHDKGGCEL